MVPLARIGLATPSLPMTCSTTELQRRQRCETYTAFEKKSSTNLYHVLIIFFGEKICLLHGEQAL